MGSEPLESYWEGWLVTFFAALNWIGWAVGVVVGIALRGGFHPRGELSDPQSEISARH